MRLLISGIELPLEDENIYQTKQINDLFSLDNRQANYTNSVKVPKTPQAIEALDLLGIPGNMSSRPYIKNDAMLYSNSGLCYVYNGWAVIESTDGYFNITIYDGNIDIYKAIDGFKLSDVPMPLLEHEKTPVNISASMNLNLKYRYMLANFGGKVETYGGLINIDYLTPFANVGYIWDCIFNHFGFTYECSLFNSSKWTDLWLSYPKGTYKTEPIIDEIEATTAIPIYQSGNTKKFLDFEMGSLNLGSTSFIPNNRFIINQSGEYEFTLKGDISNVTIHLGEIYVYMTKGNNSNPNNTVVSKMILQEALDVRHGALNVDKSFRVHLNAGEIVSFVVETRRAPIFIYGFKLTAKRRNSNVIDFQESLIDWSIKDFFNEILWKFGLTPVKDKFRKHYVFYTLEELMQRGNAVDMSSKFVSVEKEVYIYSNYAQNNFFKYKYDDEGVDYYDGNIIVPNKNLEFSRTVIQSKTFAPTKLENGEDMWKMYDKEINDNGEVSYKNLTGRFFFATSISQRRKRVRFLSDLASHPSSTTERIYIPNFQFQKYDYIVSNYYGSISNILNTAQVITANMRLNDVDVAEHDFKNPWYIKQLGSYFIVNKILNFNENVKTTKVELIQVDLVETPYRQPIFSVDTGETLFRCVESDFLRIVVDNIKGPIIFEGLPAESKLTKVDENVYELTNLLENAEVRAIVNDIDGKQFVTNEIKILRND